MEYCGKKDCPCHTPPQEKGWREAVDKAARVYAGTCYLVSEENHDASEEIDAMAALIKIVQEQIDATEKRVREEIDAKIEDQLTHWQKLHDESMPDNTLIGYHADSCIRAITDLRSLINNKYD